MGAEPAVEGGWEAPQPHTSHCQMRAGAKTKQERVERSQVCKGPETALWVPGPPTPGAAPNLAPCEGRGADRLDQGPHLSPGYFLWPQATGPVKPDSPEGAGLPCLCRCPFPRGGPKTAALEREQRPLPGHSHAISRRPRQAEGTASFPQLTL